MRFCIFLYEEGLITDQQCLEVLRSICRRTPPLGRLVIKEKLLSVQQLRMLLAKQMETSGPLGKLAVECGLLTEAQVNQLIERQRVETPSALDVVLDLRMMDSDALHAAHKKFVSLLS
ncbi:MAG: hypothetical protein ABMB14_20830 [Myxococcota bacterium]